MASQWPAPPPPGAGDLPNPPPAHPPPGQPLHGKPLHRQPPPGRPPPRSSGSDNRFYVVLLAVAAAVVVLGIGGCAVLSAIVDDSVEETSKELNDSLRKSQNRNSIPDEQGKAVDIGADRNRLVKRFGPPAFGPAKEPVVPPDVRDCISWHIRDGRYGSTWRFCFRAGKLVSKESDLSPSPRPRTPPPEAKPSQEQ